MPLWTECPLNFGLVFAVEWVRVNRYPILERPLVSGAGVAKPLMNEQSF
jgi:hypothetical protein